MTSKKKALLFAELAGEKKAEHLSIIRIGKLSSVADYIVVCSGESERQAQAIARHVIDESKDKGIKPLGTEGLGTGQWVLVDYGDVVFHVFTERIREYYDLEGLWADAPREKLPVVSAPSEKP